MIGAGYVGLITSACLASLGHRVVCADVNLAKVATLRNSEIDIREPGLAELVTEGATGGRLTVVGAAAAVREISAEGGYVEVVILGDPIPDGSRWNGRPWVSGGGHGPAAAWL